MRYTLGERGGRTFRYGLATGEASRSPCRVRVGWFGRGAVRVRPRQSHSREISCWSAIEKLSFLTRIHRVAQLEAGEGNRTLVFSLEGYCSTIELHPRVRMVCTVRCCSVRCLRASCVQWGVQDSNLRRQCHQIYSLTP